MDLLTRHQQQHAISTSDCTIHVTNLPEQMTEDNLIQFLAFPGNIVDYKKVQHVVEGEKKPMYIVVYSNLKETEAALKLNGQEIMGIEVKITTPGKLSKVKRFDQKTKKLKEEKKKQKVLEREKKKELENEKVKKENQSSGVKKVKKRELSEREKSIRRTIYLGNVNSDLSIMAIVDFFSCCGPISYVRLAGDGKQPTRFAFVEFFAEESAQQALKMNGQRLANRPIKINESNNAIVKSHVRLTDREYSRLNRAIRDIKFKVERAQRKKEGKSSPPRRRERDRYDDRGGDRRRYRGRDRYDDRRRYDYYDDRRRSYDYDRRRSYDYDRDRDYDYRRKNSDRDRDERRRRTKTPDSGKVSQQKKESLKRRSSSPGEYERKRRKYE